MENFSYYKKVLKNYAVFDGRAGRKEFWYFVLFNFLISIGIGLVGSIIGVRSTLVALYSLAVLVPSIAVGVRRLHDAGYSGWFVLLGLIPFLGAIIMIIFAVQKSQSGSNKYGPEPSDDMSMFKEAEVIEKSEQTSGDSEKPQE